MKYDYENYDAYQKCQDLSSLIEYIVANLNEIHRVNPNKKIIFILDSLDQLNKNDYKNVDLWLIRDLPKNTKYIVSTIPNHGNLLSMITKMIKKKYKEKLSLLDVSDYDQKVNELFKKQLLQVNQLKAEESENILYNWLLAANVNLTDEQWKTLRYIFKNGQLFPLFLKLIFDIVCKWRSYDKPDGNLAKCLRVDDIIIYRFHNLERIHGQVLFKRAICYMTICKNGISDNEMCDLLSLDDDVLYSVFEFSMPPIRRVSYYFYYYINFF